MTNRKRNLKKENQAELNERKQQVLWAVVQDYAETAEPVGSRTIARKYNLGVSSATIRNEMQDLEDAGYLEQPHTSAGRIPSVKGYRFYVDRLMEPAPVSGEEQNLITKMMGAHRARLDDIFRDMAKIVASLTHTLSLAASSTARQVRFNYIRFLPLDGRRVILLAVSDRGDVTNVVVPMPADTTMDELQLIADKLNHFLHGRNVNTLNENLILSFQKDVERNLSGFSQIFGELSRMLLPHQKVYTGGAAELMEQPEFQNVERMQDILNLLEQQDTLQGMLSETMERPIAVHIGTENVSKALSDLSIVRAQFTSDGRVLGSIAVMGPTRMQYGKIIGVLYYLQQELNQLLKKS